MPMLSKTPRNVSLAAGLILLSGGLYYALGLSPGGLPDGDADRIAYTCRDDGHQFTYTPRELESAYTRASDEARADPNGIPCPKCGKLSAYRTDLGSTHRRPDRTEFISPQPR